MLHEQTTRISSIHASLLFGGGGLIHDTRQEAGLECQRPRLREAGEGAKHDELVKNVRKCGKKERDLECITQQLQVMSGKPDRGI